MEIKTFVEWLTPGAFFPEESNEEITTRDVYELEIPKDVYAFHFYDIKYINAIDEEGEEHTITSIQNKSSRYIIGKVFTYEQIVSEHGESSALASNIHQYDTKCGVKTHLGNWQPLLEDDIVLSKEELKFRGPVFWRKS